MRNFTLNQKKRSTFVGFHAKKRSTFEEFYAKPKKRSTFVGFHAKKGPLLRNFTLNNKKGPLLSDFTLKKGPLLSDFTLKKVQFFQIVRVELCLLIHIPDLDQFKGGQCPTCPPYKKNPGNAGPFLKSPPLCFKLLIKKLILSLSKINLNIK